MSDYLGEFRTEWRAAASATLGLSCGLIMTSYVIGIMGPHLIAAFGWSRSELAGVQVMGLVCVLIFPFVGRIADMIGAKRTALFGIISTPIVFFAFSQVQSIFSYGIVFALQLILLTSTTPPIYCRVIVQHFTKARGLALAVAASGPPLVAAIGGPLLNNLAVAQGWQAAYYALTAFTLVCGLTTYVMMPPDRPRAVTSERKRPAREDYGLILRTPSFWLLAVSVLLCNLPQSVTLTQLNLIIAEHGVTGRSASIMISAFAMGMLVGRFVSGYALDKFPPRLVATLGFSISAFGLFAMGQPGISGPSLVAAVLAVGLSFGAEADILAFLIYRQFGVRIYSTVHGMLAAIVGLAAAVGAGSLSYVLHLTDSYRPFMTIMGVAVLIGGLALMLLPRHAVQEAAVEPAPHDGEDGDPFPRPAG
jgi:MFS family permease